MTSYRLQQVPNLELWDGIISRLPDPHILQTREWSILKSQVGWIPSAYCWLDSQNECVAACLVLKRQVRILPGWSLSVLYAPKGPLLDWDNDALVGQVLSDLRQITRDEKAIFLKIDPDVLLGRGIPGTESATEMETGMAIQDRLSRLGWRYSSSQIQFRNTIHIDLNRDDESSLGLMKQKTRYNIRLAEKKGVIVKKGGLENTTLLYQMYAETSLRNGFTIREKTYYEQVWKLLYDAGMLQFLTAWYDTTPIAGMVLFHFAKRAYYFYGMSTESHRDRMPTYLLQWEAIRTAKELGCRVYDLWGAPEKFDEADLLWGVYRFKEGLGGEVIRTLGAWDLVVNPLLYSLYTRIMPRVLNWMRARGNSLTQQEVGP